MTEKKQPASPHRKRPAEPEWIDLEEDFPGEDTWEEEEREVKRPAGKPTPKDSETSHRNAPHRKIPDTSGRKAPKKKKGGVNFHVILLALIALVFVAIAFKLLFWDKREHHNTDLENDTTLSFDTEALDSIVPLDSSDTSKKEADDDLRILFVGNGSLADDKTSDTNLANIVREKTGATVYNCAISNSYMSMQNSTYRTRYPYDAFSFYFLCTLFTIGNTETISWAERDLGSLPQDAAESIELLQSIDYSELDVLCVYYDAADYLEQRSIIDNDNEGDPTTFCGALHSGIQLIKEQYPHIRIIVMSPSYAYVVDDNGNYTSPFQTDILTDTLSMYVGFEAQTCIEDNVSFVDNFYGSIYEEIADEYLKDSILLNEKGHELLADRFLEALNKFHDYDF